MWEFISVMKCLPVKSKALTLVPNTKTGDNNAKGDPKKKSDLRREHGYVYDRIKNVFISVTPW